MFNKNYKEANKFIKELYKEARKLCDKNDK